MDGHVMVLVTTQHRGVFCGYLPEGTDVSQRTLRDMKRTRMAIRWGTTRGVAQLAETGPTAVSKIGAPADLAVLHDITAVWMVRDVARLAWEAAS